jgi:hypothetical protein
MRTRIKEEIMEKEFVYCKDCAFYLQTKHHPFYPNELIEGCTSEPEIIKNYLNRKVRYLDPREKNKENICKEYVPKYPLRIKLSNFLKKILPL